MNKPKARFIKGYPNYVITNTGEVYSCKRGKVKKLKLPSVKSGYHLVGISRRGFQSMKLVHRLVAEHFMPEYDADKDVYHLDGDKSNNCIHNLAKRTRTQSLGSYWRSRDEN